MPNTAPLRIFIASPGDLEHEREIVQSAIERRKTAGRDARSYYIVGWDMVRGTVRRPQEEINELIRSAHFMIVLFKREWGSEPGSPWGFTSGTEEELFTGLLELGNPDQPLEDVWVGFVDDANRSAEVAELASQMRERHSLLYESIANDLDLDRKLGDRLDGWQRTAGLKTPRAIDLVPRSGRDVLGADAKRRQGEALISLGYPDDGLDRLREAAELGGPAERLALARVLGRREEFEEALAATRSALDEVLSGPLELNSTLAGEAFLVEAGLLRRQGEEVQAINRLGAILGQLDGRASDSWRVRARILDERGLAYQRGDRLDEARADFEASLQERLSHEDVLQTIQSQVNLLRLEISERQLETADAYAVAILNGLVGIPPTALHANAWTAIAQLRLRQNRPQEGIPLVLQAVALNEQTGNSSGIAKALLVLAQCLRAADQPDQARVHLERCLELNHSLGNRAGAERAKWQLEQLA